VATQRTRTASKALIPSLSDAVGKLNGLGGMTVKKLLDLGNQVREARSAVLSDIPLESASTGMLCSYTYRPFGLRYDTDEALPFACVSPVQGTDVELGFVVTYETRSKLASSKVSTNHFSIQMMSMRQTDKISISSGADQPVKRASRAVAADI